MAVFFTQKSLAERALMRSRAMRIAMGWMGLFLILQGIFWWHTRDIRPEMDIVPPVPGERTIHALSFGDEEVFFRLYALGIQNSGDTFGRFTALYKYDFKKLYDWFVLLGTLNNQSSYLPAMASYYFSQTQNPRDVRYIVDYLAHYAEGRVQEKWWWVVQAIYLSQHKLHDLDRAQELADWLKDVHGIPIWAQQMPAFIHEQRGEFDDAAQIIESILKHPDEYSEGELNFMRYFVDERLGRLDAVAKEMQQIKQYKQEQRARGIQDVEPMGPPKDVGAPNLSGN